MPVVPPETGHTLQGSIQRTNNYATKNCFFCRYLHQSNGNVVEEVVDSCAVEDSVVSEIMLEPARLSLGSDNTGSSDEPRSPGVAKVPENPPAGHLEEDDVSKQGHEKPRIDFEVTLCGGVGGEEERGERERERVEW